MKVFFRFFLHLQSVSKDRYLLVSIFSNIFSYTKVHYSQISNTNRGYDLTKSYRDSSNKNPLISEFSAQKYKAGWIHENLLYCWFTDVPIFYNSPAKSGKAMFLPSEILIFWAIHVGKDKKVSLTWWKQGISREHQISRKLITHWNSAIWPIFH